MSTDHALLHPETAEPGPMFESDIRRFEDAWHRGFRPSFDEFMPSIQGRPRTLLIELAHTELELRLKSREAARVEEYLGRYPELADDRTAVLGLIVAEYSLRRRNEPALALDEYLRRFPGYREELPEEVARVTVTGSIAGREPSFWPAPHDLGALPQLLGYELLCELGRGGMGVVYKARQVRLNRLVALKMILAGDHAGSEEACRFLAEAEAVARLHHPNIVQIYAFGEQDGRPYFEMEFVAGGSLADRLDGTPWPARDAVRLVETLARALQEVHRLGIVHRDLKPANILLTGDGTPRLADFGLAKLMDIESGLTRTDHVLGSPSYMAPEQAAGGGRPVGPAADVYALGTILYELMTGRPPFRAATVLETLEQVKSAEPIAPGRLQPTLPRDLETICLQCLRKEPTRRYSSASELAEDLRRFGVREPIRARPIGTLDRAWRWCRREPVRAALVATLVAGFLGVATQWWRAERYLRLEVAAHLALREAHAREREAGRQEKQARTRAQERFRLGMKAVDGYSTLANEDELLQDPRLERLRKRLLRKALEFYKELQSSLEADPTLEARSQLAEAYDRLGSIHARTGAKADALAAHQRALEIWDNLAAADPASGPSRAGVARSHIAIGIFLRAIGRQGEAIESYERGLEIERGLARDHPNVPRYRQELAWCLSNIGAIQAESGSSAEAVRLQQEALVIREALVREASDDLKRQADLAWGLNDLGGALDAAGRLTEALQVHRRALGICRALNLAEPGAQQHRTDMARSYLAAGFLLRRLGRQDEAIGSYERGLEIERGLVRDHPNVPRYRQELAWCLSNIGAIQAESGSPAEAVRWHESALTIREALFRDDPRDPEHRSDRAWCRRDLGLALDLAGRPSDALLRFGQAVAAFEELARTHHTHTGYRERLGDSLAALGALQQRTGDPAAIPTFRRAVAIREALARDHPTALRYQTALGETYLRLAFMRAESGRADQALVDIGKAEQITERSPDVSPPMLYNLACAYAQCGADSRQCGTDPDPTEPSTSRHAADRAMAWLRRAVAAGFADVALMRRDPDLNPLRRRRDFRELLMDMTFPADPFHS